MAIHNIRRTDLVTFNGIAIRGILQRQKFALVGRWGVHPPLPLDPPLNFGKTAGRPLLEKLSDDQNVSACEANKTVGLLLKRVQDASSRRRQWRHPTDVTNISPDGRTDGQTDGRTVGAAVI